MLRAVDDDAAMTDWTHTDRARQRDPAARRRGGRGTAGAARPRLPGVVVLVAPPAAGAGRRRLPGRRHRRARLRPLVGAAGDRGLPDAAPRRRQRRPRRARWARSRPSSSATTGARRSPGTRRCCGPTCSAPSPACRCRSRRPGTPARPTPSGGWPATRSSTSSTSSSPGRAEARARRGRPAAGCSASTSRRPATPRRRPGGTVATIPHGAKMRDRFAYPDPMPTWLTDDDLDVYAGEFEHTGFTGGLNRYRNVDRDWEDLSAFRGRPIEVPALFVGGDRDGPTIWGMPSIERFPRDAAAAAPLDHPARLRALDPAGAPGRGQRGAARVPRRPVSRAVPTMVERLALDEVERRRLRQPRHAGRRARLRRTADRPGAAGRPADGRRRQAGALAAPVVRRRRHGRRGRSATRSSGPATAPASRPGASSPARRGASSSC